MENDRIEIKNGRSAIRRVRRGIRIGFDRFRSANNNNSLWRSKDSHIYTRCCVHSKQIEFEKNEYVWSTVQRSFLKLFLFVFGTIIQSVIITKEASTAVIEHASSSECGCQLPFVIVTLSIFHSREPCINNSWLL